MTDEERDKLINSILPDTVKGQQRPAENLNPDLPYSTDFPQLINKDPASADVFNLINRQLLSNDKSLNDNKADKTYVDKKVADLVNGAPEQLDTLQELSKALNNDKDYAATVNNALAEKLGKTEKAVSAGTADSANTLEGVPLSHGGDSTFGKIPVVGDDGLLEIGKYIDFHSKKGDGKDYSTRITANDDGTLSISGGVNANLHGNASSASSVPWAGVTGKPSTYPPSAHTHGLINSDFTAPVGDNWNGNWSDIGITDNGFALKSIRTNAKAPDWLLGNCSAGIAFGGEDTRGVISASYVIPKVKFAGGNGNKPVWYYSLLGSSGKEYNLDNYLPLSGGAMTGTIHKSTNDTALLLYGGKGFDNGGELALYGKDLNTADERYKGAFRLTATNGVKNTAFFGSANGTLRWNNTDLAGAGIVSQQLGVNGYIKYGSGLIYMWGFADFKGNKYVDWQFPISIDRVLQLFITDGLTTGEIPTEYPEGLVSIGWSYNSATKNSARLIATKNLGYVSVFAIGSWK